MLALYIIGGIILLILIVAAAAGTGWSYQKSISVNAPLQTVWDNVKTLGALNKWNPWMEKDPAIKVVFSGTDGNPGASYSWESNVKDVGAGSQTILSIAERSKLATRVDFLRPFKGTGEADILVREEGLATIVTWKMTSSTPYPMNIIKLFGVMQKNMDAAFGKGLNKLKGICETGG
jgi:hypothetical protein